MSNIMYFFHREMGSEKSCLAVVSSKDYLFFFFWLESPKSCVGLPTVLIWE